MKINGSNYKTIWFDSKDKVVKIIDQTLLPFEFKIISLRILMMSLEQLKQCKFVEPH
jgi:methylthioribose-1-phosphate isomerase